MAPTGFEPVKGNRFTFQTKPAGAWDGVIRCEVLEAVPNERLAYAWLSGDANNVGYGSPLDTRVTWTLTRVKSGTRLRLVHSGFVTPTNDRIRLDSQCVAKVRESRHLAVKCTDRLRRLQRFLPGDKSEQAIPAVALRRDQLPSRRTLFRTIASAATASTRAAPARYY